MLVALFERALAFHPALAPVTRAFPQAAVVLAAWTALLAVQAVLQFVRACRARGVRQVVGTFLISLAKAAPGGAAVVEKENAKVRESMRKSILKDNRGPVTTRLPAQGVRESELFALLDDWRKFEDGKWRDGKCSGTVYHGGEALTALASRAYAMFALSNPLHPDTFPFVRKMEAEVIRMSVNLFHGDENACGSMTSGGTESILMAIKAYRDRATVERGITGGWELVAPASAHVAFDKAAHYFGVKLISVPVDPRTMRADVGAMMRAVNSRTIAVVASAPGFPHGVVDPIEELAAALRKRGLAGTVGLHVDACLGSFLLPFLPALGRKVPRFDFSIPEVTSISADVHKYGFTPKGCSVVMYRTVELRRHQFFVQGDWMGGIYVSPSMAGSRPGGLIAAAWATMMHLGYDGYLEAARRIMNTVDVITRGIREELPELYILGEPDFSVIAFASTPEFEKTVDIYKVGEALSNRGWSLNTLQYPRCVHIAVTYVLEGRGRSLVDDLRASIDEVRAHPERFKDGSAAIYGLAESIPDRSIVRDIGAAFLETLYSVDKVEKE